jgi:AraC-like DNA-binding protein
MPAWTGGETRDKSGEEAIDFSGTERAFLCEPLAEEACRKARVLLEAQRELAYTRLSIKQIADGLGFSDAAFFSPAKNRAVRGTEG